MLYRSKIARVLWPLTAIATRSGTLARTMFPNCSSSQVMEQLPIHFGDLAGRSPRFTKISDGSAVPMEDVQRKPYSPVMQVSLPIGHGYIIGNRDPLPDDLRY